MRSPRTGVPRRFGGLPLVLRLVSGASVCLCGPCRYCLVPLASKWPPDLPLVKRCSTRESGPIFAEYRRKQVAAPEEVGHECGSCSLSDGSGATFLQADEVARSGLMHRNYRLLHVPEHPAALWVRLCRDSLSNARKTALAEASSVANCKDSTDINTSTQDGIKACV